MNTAHTILEAIDRRKAPTDSLLDAPLSWRALMFGAVAVMLFGLVIGLSL